MFLCEIQDAFIELLRARLRNGEVTERSLARLVGISQPHIHHVVAGKRRLTPEIMDRCLYHMRLSVLDLIDRADLVEYLGREGVGAAEYSWLPVLEGRLGPACNWPTEVAHHARFRVRASAVRQMANPVVVRAGFDIRMQPTLSEGDYLLLDQAFRARLDVDPAALYVIRRGRTGLVRRLRELAGHVYLVAEDAADRPGLWERLPAEGAGLLHFVRARAELTDTEQEWPQPRAKDL